MNGFGCLHDHICAIKNISLSVLCIVVSLKTQNLYVYTTFLSLLFHFLVLKVEFTPCICNTELLWIIATILDGTLFCF